MKKENTEKKVNMKKVGLITVAAAGATSTAVLGVLLYLKTKDCNELKQLSERLHLDLDIYKEAWEGLSLKIKEQEETAELVRTVVGGPLIDRLIKNEELKLSRIDTKIANLLTKNVDDNIKKVLEVKENDRTNILETIADFKKVKDVLKRD